MTVAKDRTRVSERPDTQKLDRRPKPEKPKAKSRRWYPWIASLVVVGIAATALVIYLVGGRQTTVTYETSFNTELAEMMVAGPGLEPIDTSGATYDPLIGTVVFPNASRTVIEPTAAEIRQALADSLIVDLTKPGPVNTLGAYYDPVAGTVVFPNEY
jgi:type II secretory pathway pseudopilin PulG